MKTAEELMKSPNNELTLKEMTLKEKYIKERIKGTSSFKRTKHLELRAQLQDLYKAKREALIPGDVEKVIVLDNAMKKQAFTSFLEDEIESWKNTARHNISNRHDLEEAQMCFIRVKAFEDVLDKFQEMYNEEGQTEQNNNNSNK